MLPARGPVRHGRRPAPLPPGADVTRTEEILPAHRRSPRALGTLTRRIALGVLCSATAGAAVLGITMHPEPTHRTQFPASAVNLDAARMNAMLRANRSTPRQVSPETGAVSHAAVPPPKPKPTPPKPTPPKPTPPKPIAKPKPKPSTPGPLPQISGLTSSEVANAWAVVLEGHRMGISIRGQIIAIATTLQESHLINYKYAVDHDSLGIFQQRPSTGWGTPKQIENPTYAAHAFYAVLLQYKSEWDCLTCAAQDVQRSAFPNAYAKWEGFATRIVTTLNKRF